MDAGSVAAGVAESAHSAGSGIAGELKQIGKSAFSQLLGHSENGDLKHGDIKELAKADDKFSQVAEEEQKAKVKAIYEEYYLRKKKQEQTEAQREKQEEEAEKLEELNEVRVAATQRTTSPQIAKTRAEIGRNYGQE